MLPLALLAALTVVSASADELELDRAGLESWLDRSTRAARITVPQVDSGGLSVDVGGVAGVVLVSSKVVAVKRVRTDSSLDGFEFPQYSQESTVLQLWPEDDELQFRLHAENGRDSSLSQLRQRLRRHVAKKPDDGLFVLPAPTLSVQLAVQAVAAANEATVKVLFGWETETPASAATERELAKLIGRDDGDILVAADSDLTFGALTSVLTRMAAHSLSRVTVAARDEAGAWRKHRWYFPLMADGDDLGVEEIDEPFDWDTADQITEAMDGSAVVAERDLTEPHPERAPQCTMLARGLPLLNDAKHGRYCLLPIAAHRLGGRVSSRSVEVLVSSRGENPFGRLGEALDPESLTAAELDAVRRLLTTRVQQRVADRSLHSFALASVPQAVVEGTAHVELLDELLNADLEAVRASLAGASSRSYLHGVYAGPEPADARREFVERYGDRTREQGDSGIAALSAIEPADHRATWDVGGSHFLSWINVAIESDRDAVCAAMLAGILSSLTRREDDSVTFHRCASSDRGVLVFSAGVLSQVDVDRYRSDLRRALYVFDTPGTRRAQIDRSSVRSNPPVLAAALPWTQMFYLPLWVSAEVDMGTVSDIQEDVDTNELIEWARERLVSAPRSSLWLTPVE